MLPKCEDKYGFLWICTDLSTHGHLTFPWAAAVRGGGPKIIRKSMLKRGAQKGVSKGEHKWLEHSLFCHLLLIRIEPARSKRCLQLSTTFHKNLKYHRKCLHLGSHLGHFWNTLQKETQNPKTVDAS